MLPVQTDPASDLLPTLRLLPAPVSDPPYDDERPASPALRLVGPADCAPRLTPSTPRPAAALGHLRPPALSTVRVHRRSDDPDDDDVVRTPSAELPPPRAFAHALVQRVLETWAGVRPLPQLQRDTSPDLYAHLEAALGARPVPRGTRPTGRDVRSLHVQQRPDGVAEVCATVHRGTRTAALALRLEGRRGRWICTELVGV